MNNIKKRDSDATSALRLDVSKKNATRQKTLRKSIDCVGIGLHSGTTVSMTLHPGEVDSGIIFRRTDIGGVVLPARWDQVVDSSLCTAIGNRDGVRIGTIEHLMAAFAGCHIDNAVVDIDGPEVPIMDGSAQPFVFLMECAGMVEQEAPRRSIRILKPVKVEHKGCSAELVPADYFSMEFEIDFGSPAVGKQKIALNLVNGTFKKEVARARTFGFEHEVEGLRAAGLALGGSLDNAVVVSGDKVLNEDGLRYRDEFVRHKVLDAVGDLYLAGAPIVGRYHGHRSGHALTRKLLETLFADPDAWCETFAEEPEHLPATPVAEPHWNASAPLAASA